MSIRTQLPKGYDKPLSEGKYHYRYNDPYDLDHINCIDCYAPYSHHWTNKDKAKMACFLGKNHYTCTFDSKFRYKMDDGSEITKNVSKKFVCFSCKTILKRPLNLSWNYSYAQLCSSGPWNDRKQLKKKIIFKWTKCYQCNNHMICVNSKFKVPSKKNDKSWSYLEKNWNDTSKMTYDEYRKIFPDRN